MRSRSFAPSVRFVTLLFCIGLTTGPVWGAGRALQARTANEPSYSIKAIGPSGKPYTPLLINDNGQMVGEDQSGNPFFRTSGKIYFPPEPAGITCWKMTGLNNRGDVAGYGLRGAGCTLPVEAFAGHISGATLTEQWLAGPLNKGSAARGPRQWVRDSATPNGCEATSINDTGEISGICDLDGRSIEIIWHYLAKQGYGSPHLLSWPTGIEGFPTGAPFTVDTVRGIDAHGDVLGVGRCIHSPSTSVAVFWPAKRTGLVLAARPHLRPCRHSVAGAQLTDALSVMSHLQGYGESASGSALVSGFCHVSGTGLNPHREPCRWNVTFAKGHASAGAPLNLNNSGGTRWGAASDANANKWIVGDQGNSSRQAILWLPAHGSYQTLPLRTFLSPKLGWQTPACGPFGPGSINSHGDIAGVGLLHGKPTGYLMKLSDYSVATRAVVNSVRAAPSQATGSGSRHAALLGCGK
jgi:hypothetical protein